MVFSLGPRAISAGYRLAAFDSIGSTNAEALSRARDGERGPIWFVTSQQTAGRGRRHRPWIAPRGNLASSVLEVIEVSPAVAATLGFAAGLALEVALQKVSVEASLRSAGSDHMKFSLKWPNDVLAGGQKLAGILLEAEAVANDRLAVVVGIGTNVVAAPEGTPTPATSRRSASTSARRSCSRPCRMHGPNCAVYGMTAAALARSGGSGWSARPGLGKRSRSRTAVPPWKERSIPSMNQAAW